MNSIASSLSKHNTTPTEPGNSGGKTVMIDPGMVVRTGNHGE
ncbi:putative N-acetylmuramoyl-L-alanine amidase,autolysin domain protein [Clostridioides difficile P64]|nr:putative N-acetylmuramoyl-L-alanine amidase,autolysin domain protein [Clostridioides difficile P64]